MGPMTFFAPDPLPPPNEFRSKKIASRIMNPSSYLLSARLPPSTDSYVPSSGFFYAGCSFFCAQYYAAPALTRPVPNVIYQNSKRWYCVTDVRKVIPGIFFSLLCVRAELGRAII